MPSHYGERTGTFLPYIRCVLTVRRMRRDQANRYAVTVIVFVDATSEDEASLILEREYVGKFDSESISVAEGR
jgi:hypothetical protein